MITFDNIEFKTHASGDGVHGLIFFPGGYGLSVVRFRNPFGRGGSYTSNDTEDYEVAIIKGTKDQWEICYDTKLTNDVLGFQTKEDINKIISHVQRLYNDENN
jgi:hypothetical protein